MIRWFNIKSYYINFEFMLNLCYTNFFKYLFNKKVEKTRQHRVCVSLSKNYLIQRTGSRPPIRMKIVSKSLPCSCHQTGPFLRRRFVVKNSQLENSVHQFFFTKSELLQLVTANVFSVLYNNSEIWHLPNLKNHSNAKL